MMKEGRGEEIYHNWEKERGGRGVFKTKFIDKKNDQF